MGMNIEDYFIELDKQRNTLSLLTQLCNRLDPNEIALVSSCGNIDQDRIDAVKAFLQTEKDEVQAKIDCLLAGSVSGVDAC